MQLTTPNKSRKRRSQESTDMAVIHYTGSMNCEGTLEWFQNPDAKVSAHFVIDLNGDVYEFEDWQTTLWHAGDSYWQGKRYCNSSSIGIELVGNEDSGFTPEQYEALVDQLNFLTDGGCPIKYIVGHQHIAPGRKVDPGPLFDWDMLRNGFNPYGNNVIEWVGDEIITPKTFIKEEREFDYQIRPARIPFFQPSLLTDIIRS